MAMAGGALQLTSALSKCTISSSSSSCNAATLQRTTSVSTSLNSSSLWGGKLAVRGIPRSAGSTRSVTRMAMIGSDDYEETEEEIRAGYEALYGKAFGQSAPKRWDSVEDKDGDGDDAPSGGRARRAPRGMGDSDRSAGRRGGKGEFEERVVQIRRVTKVVKGGKQLSFRAVVVVGDRKGRVGVGVNKAKEVIIAVQKAVVNAKRNVITVPLNKYKSFPHRADGHYGAAHVMLRPASDGTGVIAGGAVRIVLELAGVENALGKQIRSENPLNNARAVVEAITGMKTFKQVSIDRGIPMEELWK